MLHIVHIHVTLYHNLMQFLDVHSYKCELINLFFKILEKKKKNINFYPAINVNNISGFVQIYSTVGDRVPICRLSTLLKTCATSFLPSKSIRFKFC